MVIMDKDSIAALITMMMLIPGILFTSDIVYG